MKKLMVVTMFCMAALVTSCSQDANRISETENQSSIAQSDYGEVSSDNSSSVNEPDSDIVTGNEWNQDYEEMFSFNKEATLDETVLFEQDGVKITATGLSYDNYSAELNLTIENNSGKDLSFISGSLGYSCNSVNGYMTDDGYLNCDVANEKKATETISFSYDSLMLYGIHEISDLEIGFEISDDDYNDCYTGPCKLVTSAFDAHDYSRNYYQEAITSSAAMNVYQYEVTRFSKDALYDQYGIKLLSSCALKNQDEEYILLLEFENTSEETVYVRTNDIAINGLTANKGLWSSDAVNAGKRGIININLSSVLDSDYWSVYGIQELGSVSVSLDLDDADGNKLNDKNEIEFAVSDVNAKYNDDGAEVYNSNGLRIVSKSIIQDSSSYSSDISILLLAENNSGIKLSVDDVNDSLSINGYMSDYRFYGQELADGEAAVVKIRLSESNLEENSIESISDISEVEFKIEITDDSYNKVDEAKIVITQ